MPVVTVDAEDVIGAYLSRVSVPEQILRDALWNVGPTPPATPETATYGASIYPPGRTLRFTAWQSSAGLVTHSYVRTCTVYGYDETSTYVNEVVNLPLNLDHSIADPLVVETTTRWSLIDYTELIPSPASGPWLRISVTPTLPSAQAADAIDAILDGVDLDAADRDITALSTTTLAEYPIENATANSIIQALAEAEAGFLFVSNDGKITFQPEYSRSTASIVATFGATSTPYKSIKFSYGDRYIYNVVSITRTGGTLQEITSNASITEYGRSTYTKSNLPLVTDEDAYYYAAIILARYGQPKVRIEEVELSGYLNPSALWQRILVLDLNDCIFMRVAGLTGAYGATSTWLLEDTEFGRLGTTTILGDDIGRYFVEQINYTISKGLWNVTLRVSPE